MKAPSVLLSRLGSHEYGPAFTQPPRRPRALSPGPSGRVIAPESIRNGVAHIPRERFGVDVRVLLKDQRIRDRYRAGAKRRGKRPNHISSAIWHPYASASEAISRTSEMPAEQGQFSPQLSPARGEGAENLAA
jgi:hypothetical protein